ncbi:MAG: ATP-binding cassette domain-containing protein [Desulfurococcaceae archaeon]
MKALGARIHRCGYPGGFELRDVSIDLDEGEMLLVTGRSGSGKTTLIRALTGTIEVAGGFLEGEVVVYGRSLRELTPDEVFNMVTYIPQEPWYGVLGYSVYAEVCHVLSLKGTTCSDVDFLVLGLAKLLHRPVHTLSAGEVQRVLWADAVVKGSSILLLDEPMVYIDEESRRTVKHIVENALEENFSVVLVDHNPEFWSSLQPLILVLENGKCKYSGRWNPDVLEKPSTPVRKPRERGGEIVVLSNVWFKYPGQSNYVLRDFSMSVSRGVFTLVKGPNGSGKTSALRIASGILKPTRGRVERRGRCIYIPENPLLFFTMPTPREELLKASGGDENRVLEVSEVLGIKHVLDKPLAKMSTGERRRVAIASAYLAGFDAYFVDEPTGGLDWSSALSVLEVLSMLAEEKKAAVVASHDSRVFEYADVVIELGG